MTVVKLDRSHVEAIKPLFDNEKYMGNKIAETKAFHVTSDENLKKIAPNLNQTTAFNTVLYNIFCSNYLSDLKNFHAFGYVKDNTCLAMVSFYESNDEPSWFYTLYRSAGDPEILSKVLDAVIDYNEKNGRLKFYTLVNIKHSKLLRRFHWSQYNDERYGYFNEFVVPAGTKCFYNTHWELLYKRFILPNDTVIRCNYLKQEYRENLPIGGNI